MARPIRINCVLKVIVIFITTLVMKPALSQAAFAVQKTAYTLAIDTDSLQNAKIIHAENAKRTANAFGWISVITCAAFITAVTVAIVIASDSWGIAALVLGLVSLMSGVECNTKDKTNKKAWAGLSIGIVIAAPLMALWLLPYKISEGCEKRKARKQARKNRS